MLLCGVQKQMRMSVMQHENVECYFGLKTNPVLLGSCLLYG
jgi:hypothetical protein